MIWLLYIVCNASKLCIFEGVMVSKANEGSCLRLQDVQSCWGEGAYVL